MNRELAHIKVLAVSADGRRVDLGLSLAGSTLGIPVWLRADAVSETAFALLAAGAEIEQKTATPLPPIGQVLPSRVLGCTQMAVVTDADGLACLILRFGALELAVRANATELGQALALLQACSLGGIVPPTPRVQ